MPSQLSFLNSADFGKVATGISVNINITLANFGDTDVTASAIDVDTSLGYSLPTIPPYIIPAFDSILLTIHWTAGAVGVTAASNLVVTSDDPGSPLIEPVTSESVAGGKVISASPSSQVFANTKVGTDSAVSVITVTNVGSMNVAITGATFPAGFAAATPVPVYTVTLTPGQTMSIGVKFHPIGQGFAMGNVAIASDAAAGNLNIAVSGIGFLITPAFIATGTPVLLAAFGNTVLQFDPADFDCEEDCTLTRDISLYAPGYQASLMRVQLNTEAKGAATLNIAVTNRHGQTSDDDVVLSAATDDSIKAAFGNLSVTDEVLHVVFTRSADDGPVSITGYIYNFTPAGEVVPVTP